MKDDYLLSKTYLHLQEANAWLEDVKGCQEDGKKQRAIYALSQALEVLKHIDEDDVPEEILDKVDKMRFLLFGSEILIKD